MTLLDPRRRRVRVGVANLWQHPDSPRAIDAPAVADEPDVARWLAQLDQHAGESTDGEGRLGLHGRLHTQLLEGETAVVVGTDPAQPGWVRVQAPGQPTALDADGYPGWVRASHLADPDDGGAADAGGAADGPAGPAGDGDDDRLLALAREHLGLPYLWGGVSPAGFDCSGLVHWCYRQLGVVVPRDADDQQDAATPVPLDEVRPGDLYFFRHPGATRAHHVGIVTAAGSMIHAPETGQGLMEGPLDEGRLATLHGAGRLPQGATGR